MFLYVVLSNQELVRDNKTLEGRRKICDDWFNSEQTEEDAIAPFNALLLKEKWVEWTTAGVVDEYCKVLKGSTEEF